MNQDTVLSTRQLTIGYKERNSRKVISSDINLTLERGKLVCLVGPNGAGKSTLLRTLTSLQPPLHGEILLHGRPLHKYNQKELSRFLSIVLTDRVDVSRMTVYSIVSLGRHPFTNWIGTLSKDDHQIIQHALELTNASKLQHRNIQTLSDGERQKVMIARALAQKPDLMILDEPTAFLDFPHRVEIMHMLKQLVIHENCAVLLSTHDLNLAISSADSLVLIDNKGSISYGAPEDLILNGQFEATFNQHQNLTFNPIDASFYVNHNSGIGFQLYADSELFGVWTRRALERNGYTISNNDDAPVIRITTDTTQPVWTIDMNNRSTQTVHSIQELLTFIRTHFSK